MYISKLFDSTLRITSNGNYKKKSLDSNISVQDYLLSEGCVVNFEGYVESWYFVVHFSMIMTLLPMRGHN